VKSVKRSAVKLPFVKCEGDCEAVTPDQLDQLHTLLDLGRFNPQSINFEQWAFQRGFNEGIQFAIDQIKKVMAPPEEAAPTPPEAT
jgi:hypothetical protein